MEGLKRGGSWLKGAPGRGVGWREDLGRMEKCGTKRKAGREVDLKIRRA